MTSRRLPVFIALVAACLLGAPLEADATAIANSRIKFRNLTITPAMGAFSLDGPWFLTTVGRAANSLGEFDDGFDENSFSFSPEAVFTRAEVTSIDRGQGRVTGNADGHASALNDPPDLVVEGSANTAVNVPGCDPASAEGIARGIMFTNFTLSGGGREVAVGFGIEIVEEINLMTDHCGLLALGEVEFVLTVDGNPVLSYKRFSRIGPNDSYEESFIADVTNTVTLPTDVSPSHFLQLVAYSRSEGVVVPEPPTGLLLIAGFAALAAAKPRPMHVRS